jgi:hypothetical protein
MPEVILNSFASTDEMLRYAAPQNTIPYSTVSISGAAQTPIKMHLDIQASESSEPIVGSHLREAVAIVKDWARHR